MEKIKTLFSHKIFKIIKWVFLILLALYFILVIYRVVYSFNVDRTNAQVEKIHSTKLTMDDVVGTNLPPDPGAEADKTVQGIDANKNGIRDDVEIAIFKEYPNSAKTRAVLLQYALAMQMEFTQPTRNKNTVIAVTQEDDKSYQCVADALVPRESPESSRNTSDMAKIKNFTNFVENKQLNTEERKNTEKDFLKKIGSYNSLETSCDIDFSKLPN